MEPVVYAPESVLTARFTLTCQHYGIDVMDVLFRADASLAVPPPDEGVRELVGRFFQAFDDKDWRAMRGCLCDEVVADYTLSQDLLGGTLTADLYIEQCRFALQVGDVRHTFFNLRIGLDGEREIAEARCNYILQRSDALRPGIPDHFNAYGHYEFAVLKLNREWRISRIAQTVLRNRQHRQTHRSRLPPGGSPLRQRIDGRLSTI